MKLSRTEQVVAKQLYSLAQQNRVEGLLINAASGLDTGFQVRTSLSLFSWVSTHSPFTSPRGPTSKIQTDLCNSAKRYLSLHTCLWTTVEISRYSQGGMSMWGPHMPSWGTDQIWTWSSRKRHRVWRDGGLSDNMTEGKSFLLDVPRRYPKTMVRQHRLQDKLYCPNWKPLGHREGGCTRCTGSA